MRALRSATLSRIFSSSLSCFSRALSLRASAFFLSSVCWSSRLTLDLRPYSSRWSSSSSVAVLERSRFSSCMMACRRPSRESCCLRLSLRGTYGM
uniref:Putative secreted protein n=1 Tax=Ixodes ricinus TaxID=34613 RepID=A0A6B0UE44_IXORI